MPDDSRDRLTLRLSDGAKSAIEYIKQTYNLATDAEAIRIALSTEKRVAEAHRKNERILVADSENQNIRELVFTR